MIVIMQLIRYEIYYSENKRNYHLSRTHRLGRTKPCNYSIEVVKRLEREEDDISNSFPISPRAQRTGRDLCRFIKASCSYYRGH